MADSQSTGAASEQLAAELLADAGYRVIARNYRSRVGEIDIIATADRLLVLVEVKQRTGSRHGAAVEAVDARKIQRILDTADVFVMDHPEYAEHVWRLDLVAVTLNRAGKVERIEHIENVVVD